MDTEGLASRLSRPLNPADPWELQVTGLELIPARPGGPTLLRLLVEAAATRDAQPETWEWSLPLDDEDLEMLPDAFVVTVRANLEEWWCTKGHDPGVARLGRRLA